jgi:LDH2 family malate/lactate/ureidoglycolate dehydrogenase
VSEKLDVPEEDGRIAADVPVVPAFGRNAAFGTNPIPVAAPADRERSFVLDMATGTVPRGKLEPYNRLEKPFPLGWVTDETGTPTTDTGRVPENSR